MGQLTDAIRKKITLRTLQPAKVMQKTAGMMGFLQAPTSPAPDAAALIESEQISAIVGRCVNVISQDAAQVPLRLFSATDPDEPEEITDHPAILLWRHINPVDSPVVFLEQLFADLVTEGNFFSYLDFEGNTPSAMIRLPPEEIKVIPHPTMIIGGYLWERANEKNTYSANQIMHIRTRNPSPDYRGLGLLPRGRDQIRFERHLRAWKEYQIKNGIPTSMVISVKKAFGNDADFERFEDEVWRRQRGIQNVGKPMIVRGEDVDVTPIDRPKEDEVAWIASLNHVRNEIAMLFGVPPSRLSDYSESFRATAPEQSRTYWQDTIMGWHNLFIDYLNNTFIPRFFREDVDQKTLRPRIKFAFDYSKVRALALSARDMATVQEILIRNGMRTPNQGAMAMGDARHDDPAADKLYMNGSPLGENPFGSLSGSVPSGGENRPVGETDPDDGDSKSEPNSNDDGSARGVLLWAGDVTPRRPSLRVVPSDVVNPDEEAARLRKKVEQIIREMIRQAGLEEIDANGILGSFDMKDPLVLEAVRSQSIEVSQNVTRVMVVEIRKALAVAINEGYDPDQMRKALRAVFKTARADWRLDRIARTESHQAHEAGGYHGLRQSGVEKKRWITGPNPRNEPRADHLHMDGQVQPLDSPFIDPQSGARLMYPGDVSGAVSASDLVNCNCTKVADFSDLLGERVLRRNVDISEIYERKAKTRRRFEYAFKLTVRSFLKEMEERAIAELARQTNPKEGAA